MERFKLLGTAGLLLLAASSWAGQDKERRAQAQIEALEQSASDPEGFKNYVDGSVTRQGVPAEPAVRAAAAPAGQAADLGPQRHAPKQSLAVLPPAPRAAGLSNAASQEEPIGLLLPGLAVGTLLVFGLLFMDDGRRPIWTARPLASAEPPPPLRAPTTPALGSPMPAAPEPAPAMAQEPFIDTRMPCPTWRAISLAEQRLIEAWDRSPEKALGQASLDEWLDSRTDAGVDIPRLKAKLQRDA